MPLGEFPTRVERAEGLVGPDVELWVKREDESGGSNYGGNKVRKLEFLLGRARAENRTRLVTFGQYASHHVAATALYGAREGFTVDAVLFPQPVDDSVRTMLRVHHAAGAKLVPTRSVLGVVPAWARACLARDAMWLAGGGSSLTGTLGAASLAFEIAAQVRSGVLPPPDVVYCAIGSGGTVAGLTYGLRLERPIEIVGVNAADPLGFEVHHARTLVRRLDALLGPLLPREMRSAKAPVLRVDRRYAGRMSQPTRSSRAAVELARAKGQLALEPVYTGKAMASLLSDAQDGRLRGKRVLFVHSWNGTDLSPVLARSPSIDCMPTALRRLFPEGSSPETVARAVR